MSEVKNVRGAKFFQKELDILRLYVNEYQEKDRKPGIPASTIAAYIVSHFYCDDFGRIKAKDFCLKHIADTNQLPYSSLYKGMKHLFDLKLIDEVIIDSQEYYVLTGYELLNTPEKGADLNYFYIPSVVLSSGDLRDFIHARDSQGLIGLLELLNNLYRSNSINKKGGTIKRYAKDFMQKLSKTARNINDWVKRISAYIIIQEQVGKKRKEKLWTFALSDSCFTDTPADRVKAKIAATLRKEVQATFTHSTLNFDSKAFKDIYGAILQDGLDTFYGLVRRERLNFQELISKLYDCHTAAFKELMESYQLNIVRSVGAFYRTVLRSELNKEYYKLSADDRIELLTGYAHLYKKSLPDFLTAKN